MAASTWLENAQVTAGASANPIIVINDGRKEDCALLTREERAKLHTAFYMIPSGGIKIRAGLGPEVDLDVPEGFVSRDKMRLL